MLSDRNRAHPSSRLRRTSLRAVPVLCAVLLAASVFGLAACSQYEPVDTTEILERQYRERLGKRAAAEVEVPFALSPEIIERIDAQYKTGTNEKRRVEQVLSFIFDRLRLEYSLTPTRNAVDTYAAREGNCLSFVNLFVGLARHQRLNPFYVEVTDYQRWNYRQGMVVSRGHIVAGMYVDGELKTYDFLPYRAKAYKDFNPIDDITAAAHYYNNLGAEALLDGKVEEGLRLTRLANQIDPAFTKAINNLGVAYARSGQPAKAIETYRQGLEIEGTNVALLTNLARSYQQQGRIDEALSTLAQVEGINTTNPFFYIYKGELALAQGDHESALSYMVDAQRRDREMPEVHLGLVKVYVAAGDLEKARRHLERALRLDATNAEARRFAAMLAPSPDGPSDER